jgi:hypothetical protein
MTTDSNVARLSCFAQRKRAPVALTLFTASALDKSVTDAYSHLSIQFQGSIDEVKESVRGIYITLICQYMSPNQLIAEHLYTKSGDGYAFPQFRIPTTKISRCGFSMSWPEGSSTTACTKQIRYNHLLPPRTSTTTSTRALGLMTCSEVEVVVVVEAAL